MNDSNVILAANGVLDLNEFLRAQLHLSTAWPGYVPIALPICIPLKEGAFKPCSPQSTSNQEMNSQVVRSAGESIERSVAPGEPANLRILISQLFIGHREW